MQKFMKKLAVIVSIVCLALTLGLFAACGNDKDDNKVTYTVTVLLPDGTPAGADIAVGFCVDNCDNAFTNANGVATYEGEKGVNYHIQISFGCPAGYAIPEDYTSKGNHYTNDLGTEFTITLIEKAQ